MAVPLRASDAVREWSHSVGRNVTGVGIHVCHPVYRCHPAPPPVHAVGAIG